jgi:hypothetical protein
MSLATLVHGIGCKTRRIWLVGLARRVEARRLRAARSYPRCCQLKPANAFTFDVGSRAQISRSNPRSILVLQVTEPGASCGVASGFLLIARGALSIHAENTNVDVAGIETLTMGLEAGRIVLRWDGYSAAVDASASDAECKAAVRNAPKLPPVSLIPDKPAATPAAAPSNGVSTM